MNLKHLNLTDILIKVPHGARTGTVRKAYEKEDVNAQWEKTAWAQKLARKVKRASLNDFDRFKLKLAKQRVCSHICIIYLIFTCTLKAMLMLTWFFCQKILF